MSYNIDTTSTNPDSIVLTKVINTKKLLVNLETYTCYEHRSDLIYNDVVFFNIPNYTPIILMRMYTKFYNTSFENFSKYINTTSLNQYSISYTNETDVNYDILYSNKRNYVFKYKFGNDIIILHNDIGYITYENGVIEILYVLTSETGYPFDLIYKTDPNTADHNKLKMFINEKALTILSKFDMFINILKLTYIPYTIVSFENIVKRIIYKVSSSPSKRKNLLVETLNFLNSVNKTQNEKREKERVLSSITAEV